MWVGAALQYGNNFAVPSLEFSSSYIYATSILHFLYVRNLPLPYGTSTAQWILLFHNGHAYLIKSDSESFEEHHRTFCCTTLYRHKFLPYDTRILSHQFSSLSLRPNTVTNDAIYQVVAHFNIKLHAGFPCVPYWCPKNFVPSTAQYKYAWQSVTVLFKSTENSFRAYTTDGPAVPRYWYIILLRTVWIYVLFKIPSFNWFAWLNQFTGGVGYL